MTVQFDGDGFLSARSGELEGDIYAAYRAVSSKRLGGVTATAMSFFSPLTFVTAIR